MNKTQITATFNVFMLMMLSIFGFAQHKHSPDIKDPVCGNMEVYWTPYLAKMYAKFRMSHYGWDRSEWKALNKLWTKESNWRAEAFNKEAVSNGKHAGGIPQILGLDPQTPAPQQVERGLAYISHRYNKPSIAWAHHRVHGWY